MAEIIPVLNVKTLKGLEKSLDIFKKYRGWFQLDVADGKFTAWKNFHDIGKIKLLKIKNPLEIHLMIENPEKNIEDWIFLKPKRLILQLEAIKDFDFIYNKTKKAGIELGLAICPETPVSSLYKYMDKVNFVLMLGVIPGPSGQEFENYVLDKIKDLKKKYPKTMIELDGGVNMEIAKKATLAGADYLVTGSFIFNSPNPLEALEILKKSI